MSLLLDAGALIAYERGSRVVRAFLTTAERAGVAVRTSTTVVAQVWRRGPRVAPLALLLRGVEEVPLSPDRARRVGLLLERARSSDVVDAALVELADYGDEILTSDLTDIARLAKHAGKTILVTPVG